jgi:Ca2+-binding EF-hand superfamily protein
MATISVHNFLTHQKLDALFKQFDLDGNNVITGDEIRNALAKMGKDITNEEIEHIMVKHDFSGDK